MRKMGFCISYNDFESLEDGEYNVKIDTELIDGELNYGELILLENQKRILSTYISSNGK